MKKRNAFLLGTLLGVATTLILAPKSGKELQKDLKDKLTDVQDKIKELDVEEVRESFLVRLDEVKALVTEFDWEASKSELEKRASDIKDRLDALLVTVEEAKDQIEDVIEEAIEEISDEVQEDFTIVIDTVKDSVEDVVDATKETVEATKAVVVEAAAVEVSEEVKAD